ncbi:alpha-glucosidase [Propioniciclava soli]|uniref:Alpha-glucosidase n=1 Tax=Propioniciclava soli TaxID=2775081 RepID=A0ABZ3C8B1_9ACTN
MEQPLSDPWWSDAVVYQIYPRSFCDSNGDGVGDLQGIISKLDYVADLGVDVVWLSPIYASPQDDNGYDIADYEEIDPLFGTMGDFEELVAGLHRRGLKLVMDLVVNHTSDEHAWFQSSRDPQSPKREWYHWRPAREGFEPGTPGAEPTNWGSFFGGSAWAYDEASGEYYLHLFSRKQPDLNWENPEVREAVYAMMNRWVERGVDGFRMDVINLISKTMPLADGHQRPGEPYSFEVERVANGPRMVEFLEEMNAAVGIDARQLFTVGEMVMCTAEQARIYTSRAHPRLGMVFTFEHMSLDQGPGSKFELKPLHLPDLKTNLAHWQEQLGEEGWNSLYFENHDQPRVVSRFGDDSPEHRVAAAKAWATVLHLHRGTPYVYQGQEIGMTNAGFTRIKQYRDIESLNYFADATAAGVPEQTVLAGLALKSRDNARTPIPWGAGPQGGFTRGTPWLPLNANADTVNVQAALAASDGVRAHYQRLIALRHELEVIQKGRFDLLLPEDPKLWVFTRTLTSEQVLVVANMSAHLASVPVQQLPDLRDAELLLGGSGADIQTLEPWEARVYLVRG